VDDADAGVLGVARTLKTQRLPAHYQPSVEVGDHSGEDLHERALAGAVLADDRMQFAFGNFHVDITQSGDARKALRDVLDGNQVSILRRNLGAAPFNAVQNENDAKYCRAHTGSENVTPQGIHLEALFQIAPHAVDLEQLEADPGGKTHAREKTVLHRDGDV